MRAQIATSFGKGMPDIGHGTIDVIGHGFDQHRHTA